MAAILIPRWHLTILTGVVSSGDDQLDVDSFTGMPTIRSLGFAVIIMAVLMILVEVSIMLVLDELTLDWRAWQIAVLDALLLSAVVGPVTYWALVRPRDQKLRQLLLQLEEQRNSAEHLVRVDALTGVLSRRAIYEVLASEWSRAKRYGQPFACLMVDVDFFKSFNDNYGHQVGDQMLICIAGAIAKECRTADRVGRYGGEEFLVVLPQTDIVGAVAAAERMRKAVEGAQLDYQGVKIGATVSIGGAADTQVPDTEALVALADANLYIAKGAGRNCVSVGKSVDPSSEEAAKLV